jgi:hypothetical protein
MHNKSQEKRRRIDLRGHPLKGRSREKTPLPIKKMVEFFLEKKSQQRDIVFVLVCTRYFFFIGSRSEYTDPHQSPIGIKAIVF